MKKRLEELGIEVSRDRRMRDKKNSRIKRADIDRDSPHLAPVMAPGCGLLFVNPGYLYEIHCVGSDEKPCEQERIDESAEINLACSDVTPMSNDTKTGRTGSI